VFETGSASVPVVLPRVVVCPEHARSMTVTLDGQPVSDAPIPQVQLGEAISQIIEQLGTAVRVEIHEPDGTVHADILTPPAGQPRQPAPAADRPHRRGRSPLVEVWAGGSEPGEAAHGGAAVATAARDPDRHGGIDLDPNLADSRGGPVLMAGATSGATHVQEPA